MGALARFQAYIANARYLPAWSFAQFAQQYPVDMLSITPGLSTGTSITVTPPTWDVATPYLAGDKVIDTGGGGGIYVALSPNTGAQPSLSPSYWATSTANRYPAVNGETSGEIYLTTDVTPPEAFFWYGAWYPLASSGSGGGSTYVLPTASASVLGGIKVGTGLAIDGSGVLSASGSTYTLPTASNTVLGGIKVGTNLSIDGSGVLSASAAPYTLPTASASVLGGIKVGTNLSIDGSGVLSATGGGTVQTIGAHEKAGFVNRTTSTLSFNNGSRDFTLTPVGTCVVWAGNTKYSYTTPQVVNLSNTVAVHFVYIDSAGVLSESTVPWGGNDATSSAFAMVAFVYWNGSVGATVDERHSSERNRDLHNYLHNTRGATYYNGLAGTFTNTTISLDSGAIYDEDILFDISGPTTTVRVWYRTSLTSMTFESLTTPYKTVGGVLQYDNAGTLTPVDNNKYVVNWVYVIADTAIPVYVITSQAQYNNLSDARVAPQPTSPNLSFREAKLAYSVIYRWTGTVNFIESSDLRTVQSMPNAAIDSLPAANVTFAPWDGITATNVQTAFTQVLPITSSIADSGSAVAATLDTANVLVTSGAKLLSIKNHAVEKFYITKDGEAYANGVHLGAGGGITAPYTLAGVGDTVPFTTNAIAGQTASLQSWQVNGVEKAYVGSSGNANFPYFVSLPGANSGTLYVWSTAADSAGSVGIVLNTGNPFVTSGSKLVSVRTGNAEQAYIDMSGRYVTTGTGRGAATDAILGQVLLASAAQVTDAPVVANRDSNGSMRITGHGSNAYTTVAAIIDNDISLSAGGSKLLSVRNNGSELVWIDYTGRVDTAGGFTSTSLVNPNGMLLAQGNVTDGASAIGVKISAGFALTTAGAKVASFYNGGVEKAYVDKDGHYVGGAAYGSMYENNDPTGTILAMTLASTFYKWVSTTAGVMDANSNVTYNSTNKQLVIGTNGAGDYFVTAHITASANLVNQILEIAVFVNNSESILRSSTKITTNNDEKSWSVQGILALTAGATVDLRVEDATAGTVNVNIQHCGLSIRRIS